MGLVNWLQSLVSAAKYYLIVFLRKDGSLGEFYSLLVLDWVYYRFMNLKGVAYRKIMDLASAREHARKSDMENQDWR